MKRNSRRDALLKEQMVLLLPRLRRFARSLTGEVETADDLVQMACERSLQRLGQYRDGTRFDSWLYQVVYTQWIDQLRRRKRRSAQAEKLKHLQKITGENQASPQQIYAVMDVKDALNHIPDENRAAVILVAVEGHTYAEAASVLGVPVGTVASRVARAREMLGKQFQKYRPGTPEVHTVGQGRN
ncbi:MAG: RNA polymerase sigma factor [Desulfobacterales bacterium]